MNRMSGSLYDSLRAIEASKRAMEAIRANRTNVLKDNIDMWQDITHMNEINKSGGGSDCKSRNE